MLRHYSTDPTAPRDADGAVSALRSEGLSGLEPEFSADWGAACCATWLSPSVNSHDGRVASVLSPVNLDGAGLQCELCGGQTDQLRSLATRAGG